MYTFTATTGRDALNQIVDAVLAEGQWVSPRGFNTIELSPATVTILNPRDTMPTGINRAKLKPAIGVAEALQGIAGVSLPDLMGRVSPVFNRFRNEDGEFDGAYGPRLRVALQHVAKRLKNDPDTRQAIAPIWWPHDSTRESSKDYPCTLILHFLVRDEKLNLHVTMRSNDIWLGFPYDIFQFTQVQLSMANCLGLEVGKYVHTANSLHLYEQDIEAASNLAYAEDASVPRLITNGIGRKGDSWHEIAARAERILRGQGLIDMTPSERTYDDIMDPYTQPNTSDAVLYHVAGNPKEE